MTFVPTPDAQVVLGGVVPPIQQVSRQIIDGVGVQRQQALLDLLDDIRQAIVELPDTLPAHNRDKGPTG